MLDKNNGHNIDKAFIKSSWKDMSQLLEQEMPVEEKEKNYLVLVLSGLLVLSLLTVAYLAHLNLQKPKFVELTKEKVSYKNIYIPVEVEAKEKAAQKTETQNVTQGVSPVSFNSNTFFQNQPTISQSLRNFSASSLSNVSTAQDLLVQINDMIPVAQNLGQISHRLNKESKAPLMGLSLADLPLNGSRAKRKFKYTLATSAISAHNMDFTGYAYSVGLSFPIAKKVSVNVGLAHSELSRDFYVLPTFSKNSKAAALNSLARPVLRTDVNQEDLYRNLSHVSQVYVPLKFDYALNDKWSVFSGVNFRYTYNREIRNPFSALINREQRSQKKGELERKASSPGYYNDSNVGLVAGVNYNLNKFLSVKLDSEWGANSILQQSAFDYAGNNYRFNFVSFTTQFAF